MITVSPCLVSKYPGRAPPRRTFLVVLLSGVGLVWSWVFCLGVFSFVGSPARIAAFFIQTHSHRETWGVCGSSTPHGFAYCESSSEGWVSSPAGQYLSSRPSSVVTWDCASPLPWALLSRAPHSDCDSPPWPLPGVSPF